eukprot:TRINITY_DN3711_c0_g1_i1.p1 TRINITY_DN3711_c0_g1~~TRINITY_DN3711_c0_g1_i1.p1  ORF type:complete len:507 (+),score=170.05 TRINITY_DN3711_c0_g1_i1:48-1568(+)
MSAVGAAAKNPLWLIAVPTDQSATVTQEKLAARSSAKRLSDNYRFLIPDLKVGTLDTLMTLSDSLSSVDSESEQLVKRIQKTFFDLLEDETVFSKIDGDVGPDEEEKNANDGNANDGNARAQRALLVNDQQPVNYLQEFKWDGARFPLQTDLTSLSKNIQELVEQYSEDLKKNWGKYSETKTALMTLRRKNQGSLLLRPLSGLVDPEDYVEGEFLTTLMVVIPENRESEFLKTYLALGKNIQLKDFFPEEEETSKPPESKESVDAGAAATPAVAGGAAVPVTTNAPVPVPISAAEAKQKEEEEKKKEEDALKKKEDAARDKAKQMSRVEKLVNAGIVVPGSAKLVVKDGGFALYRIVVMGLGAEVYKNVLRSYKFTVRPFKYDPNEVKMQGDQEEALKEDRKKRWRKLLHWTIGSFSEVFRAWIHLKAIRLFVESVLRYGLPVNFQAFLLKVALGKDKILRAALGELYSGLAGAALTAQGDSSEVDFSGLGQDFYPYVYLGVDPYV